MKKLLHKTKARTLPVLFGAAMALYGSSAAHPGLDPSKPIKHFHQDVWTTAEGLPQDGVLAIVQRHDDYLWFGTEQGLVRFDGLRFTVFDKTNTPALRSNFVRALATDGAGDLWIGTRGGGLTRLRNGKFKVIKTRQGSTDDSVESLLNTREGDLWIGTEGSGALRLHDGHFTRYSTKNGLPNDEVFALAQRGDGSIWIGTRDGLSRFKDDAIVTYKGTGDLPSAYVRSLYASPSGALWIGTDAGLVSLRDGKFHSYSTKDGLPSNAISAIREDSRGSLWIGTVGGGLARMAGSRFDSYSVEEGLPNNDVWAILQDKTGDLWIGTAGGGLARLSSGKLFTSYGTRQGLSNPVSLPVLEDREGSIWIGTYGGGLNRFRNEEFDAFTTKNGLPDNLVFTVCQDPQGTLWIGTRKGLTRLKNGRFTTYTKKDGLPSDIIDVAYADAEGNLWIGTRTGLGRLSNGISTIYTTKDGMSGNVVEAIYGDREGAVWIGTADGGLDRFRNGKFEVFDSRQGLSSEQVYAMYEDAEGILWVGTQGGGLDRLKNGRFIAYTTKEGLPDDAIFQILEDDSNNLWMSSNKGVFRVPKAQLNDFAEKKISHITAISYGAPDGMNTQECNGGFQPAGWKSHDGRLWFPTMKGVVVVDPKKVGPGDSAPPIILEQAFVDRHEVDLGGDILVPPGRGELEFRYSAPNFQSPQKTIFKYKLDGFDSGWRDAGTRRTAYYTNIPPGNYRFQVIASNGDGTWSSPSASIGIKLESHFYQTLWFYALCILGVVGLAGAGHVRHVREANERERVLEQRVQERTAQLRKEIAERERAETELVKARDSAQEASRVKSEFLANMSHEIRTPMNGILGMTDLALATELTAEQHEYLGIVKNSADSLLTVINDILDFSKVEAGKLELDPTDFNLRESLEETVRLVAFRAHQKGLELICDVDPEVPETVKADPMRLRQVVLNLLGNAIKFTDRGEVVLQARLEGRSASRVSVHFIVRDTGIGIPPEKQGSIFEAFSQAENSTTRKFGGTGLGLAISWRLIELMGGRIWVSSEVGRGSEFHFMVDFDAVAGKDGSVTAERVNLENVHVLIVDHHLTNRELLTNTLARWGARTAGVVTAEEAIAALQMAKDRGDPFSVVLTDAHIPEVDGTNFVERVNGNRDSTANTEPGFALRGAATILMISTGEQLAEAARSRRLSIAAYLTKPVRQRDLREALRRAQAAAARFPAFGGARSGNLTDPARAGRSLRILVAEDNRVNQKLTVRLLEKRGHAVLVADNGTEALAALERERVDMVLMDVQMPGMDGFQVTSAIREREAITGEHVPIFAMTACALKGDQERCVDAGMDGYISKPIRPDELFAAVENVTAPAVSAAWA